MVKEINLFEYLKDFEEMRTALSDYYVRMKDCRIFGSYEGGSAVGFLLAERRAVCEVLVLCAKDDDAEVKNALLSSLLDALPAGSSVRWRILNGTQNENAQIAERLGFTAESVLHIFHYDRREEGAGQGIYDLIEHYTPCCRFIERQGYVTKCFDDLSEDELHQIKDNPDGEFAPYLDSGDHIRGKTGKLDGKCSFATVLDGKVYAYTIVVAHGEKSCIVENTSVARSARKGGTFILPFVGTLSAIAESSYDTMLYAIYDTNDDALPLMRKHFATLLNSETVQRSYIYTKKGK